MAQFVFAYSGGSGVSDDESERADQYAQWERWFAELGNAVIDGGAATGAARTVRAGGEVTDSGSCGLTGYSIVAANDLDAAVTLARRCPVLTVGGSVDVYERIAM